MLAVLVACFAGIPVYSQYQDVWPVITVLGLRIHPDIPRL